MCDDPAKALDIALIEGLLDFAFASTTAFAVTFAQCTLTAGTDQRFVLVDEPSLRRHVVGVSFAKECGL